MVASRRPVTFFAPPKKVTKERGSPVRRRYLVNSLRDPCAARPGRAAAQLAQRQRYCRPIKREVASVRLTYTKLAQCSPTAPCLICAARRRTGAPRSKSVPLALRHWGYVHQLVTASLRHPGESLAVPSYLCPRRSSNRSWMPHTMPMGNIYVTILLPQQPGDHMALTQAFTQAVRARAQRDGKYREAWSAPCRRKPGINPR